MGRKRSGLSHISSAIWQTREFRLLAPIVLILGLLTLFIHLAEEVLEGDTHTFDTAVLLAFRSADPSDPIGPSWFEAMMSDLTSMGGYTVLTFLSLVAIGYLLLVHKRASALLVAASGFGATLLNQVLKAGFDRPRPDLVSHLAEVHSLSFPSGHAMLSAVIYLTLGALLARTQSSPALKGYILVVAMLLTGLVGVSRVYLGVHWPTDVLAGWCLGGAWALFCLKLVSWWEGTTRDTPPV